MFIAIRMRNSERYEILKKSCNIKSGKTVQPKEENNKSSKKIFSYLLGKIKFHVSCTYIAYNAVIWITINSSN